LVTVEEVPPGADGPDGVELSTHPLSARATTTAKTGSRI
jgi:hypothetical protein